MLICNNHLNHRQEYMEYFKRVMSLMCLFDMEEQQKEAVSLKRYITVNCKRLQSGCDQKIDEATVIREMCQSLETHELGSKAPWIKLQKNKKILLLDLDKTLIYYSHSTGLQLRPFLNQFLKQLKNYYSIYVFTSATKSYVKQVFEKAKALKAELGCIKGVLTRQNCIQIVKQNEKKAYVKDLRILNNCQLSDIVIVDDVPVSYCMNIENAVPILPYSGQTNDNQLKETLKILLRAAQYQDVRYYLPRLHSHKKANHKISQVHNIRIEKVQMVA